MKLVSRHIFCQLSGLERCIYNARFQTTEALIQDDYESLTNAKPFEEIPGHFSLPLFGTTWTYLPLIGKYNPLKLHEASILKYKKFGPISRENITGSYQAVLVYDPKDMEKVFRQEGKYPSRPGLEILAIYRSMRPDWYKSGGLAVLMGKEWHEFRTSVQQTMLRPKSVLNYIGPMDEVANDMICRIQKLKDVNEEVPDFLNELYKWALESLATMALNKRLGCLEDKLDPDSRAMQMIRAAHGTFEGMNKLLFVPLQLWKYIPTRSWKKFVEAQDSFASIAVEEVKQAMESIKNNTDPDRDLTFIESLLTNKNIDPRDAVTMLLDMLLVGVDTTTHATSFAIYYLAKNPTAQEKAYTEVSKILSKGEPITSKIMNELHYLKACIKESMRIMPIASGTVRALDRDIVLSGYRIPAGVVIMFQNFTACRQEKYFPQADKYLPERWLTDEKDHHPFLFLPFGFGRRMCIGRRIAEQEMMLILTKIIQNFRVEYHHEDIDCYSRLVNVPDKPLRFKFVSR
uniref:Putative cytochrome P450 301a1, mitochondrial n=1 Tax=Hadrurus spadix TaxID=141984 RepID=A0A1W7RAQ8_9SCOR